jgi:arylsulfate sulfotransferase
VKIYLCALLMATFPWTASGMSPTLTPSIPSPAPVATLITFAANVPDSDSGTLWYRFRSHGFGQDSQIIKDFGPENTLVWTEHDHEGIYEIDVDVRNTKTGDIASAASYFELHSLVTGTQPVITPTSHQMVYLYSAPACKAGQRMRVQFTGPDGVAQYTPFQNCKSKVSMNFYLAGMSANVPYSVMHILDTGSSFVNGPVLSLTTPLARTDLTDFRVDVEPSAREPYGVLLHSPLLTNPVATDLNGNLLWYYPNSDITVITRPAPGGLFFGILENTTGDQSTQVLREFDLVGMTVRATNAARVNEQLAAMGKRQIGAFHHEARQLPDGRILTLGSVEQIMSDIQGPGPVDIVGDMIIVLDSNLQVVWTWDTFDHLDVTHKATLQDLCSAGGCAPLFQGTNGNDWTHGNSVQQTTDGSLLYSSRSQDMVYKIDYQNGSGSGDIIWRLGKDGDFQIQSSDPSPWFSHQHDPQLLPDGSTIALFDNGNGRNLADPSANSRGQVLKLDEQAKTANLTLNADLGHFSVALGAAQRLPNGNYHFDNGYLVDGTYTLEVTPTGQIVYSMNGSSPEYRSFRMPDLYSPPFGTH